MQKKIIKTDDEIRDEFERWYIKDLNSQTGKNYSSEDLKNLRLGDSYDMSLDPKYLDGCWQGWKSAYKKIYRQSSN
jgi:hypothetical protein